MPKESVKQERATESKQEAKRTPPKTSPSSGTYLCKINGKDWAYTKGSGIVSRNKKTGKRTAIVTFKKKLEEGSESVQLYYDGDTFQLEGAMVSIKVPKKDGGRLNAFYGFYPETRSNHSESVLTGTIDISTPSTVSGNAGMEKLKIKLEKELLENPEDDTITVTDLKFSDINYSDLNKVFAK